VNEKKINISAKKPRVLIAPLDWGLGHATRCIPLVKELFILDCEVIIAAENAVAVLLAAEFPSLIFLPLKGYDIRYGGSGKSMTAAIAAQLPKIARNIHHENKWLKKAVIEHNIDLIISDNRPGLYHKTVPCIYITHQLKILTGNRLGNRIAQKLHYRYINRFTLCLVPDAAGAVNLAGVLSHPEILPSTPVRYIGPLSRFRLVPAEKKYDLLILLSGPEPQRTIFEEILLKQLKGYSGKCLLVRGLPGQTTVPSSPNENVEIKNHLEAAALNIAGVQAQLVLSRSGYTTVMDLVKLRQKAILVATPGQPEQEYLSEILMEQRLFFSTAQQDFSLEATLKNVASFSYHFADIDLEQYKPVLKDILDKLL